MSGRNAGGLAHINASGPVEQLTSQLLQGVAQSSGQVTGVQITIQWQPQVNQLDEGNSDAQGIWVRQQLDTGAIVVTWIPDDPQQELESRELQTGVGQPDFNEKATWEASLGNPQNVDINQGTCLLRIDSGEQGGITNWLPRISNQQPIRYAWLSGEGGDGGVVIDSAAYRQCRVAKIQAGNSTLDATLACLPRLFR